MDQPQAKKKFYKRWWFWVLVVLFLFIAIGSSNNDSGSTTTSKESPSDAVHQVGEAVPLGKSVITVNDVEFSQGAQYSKPTEGNEWVDINITIQNTSSSQQFVTTLGQMYVRDAAGNSYQVAVTGKAISDMNNRLDGAVIANSKRTGWVGFEVPKGATGLQFQYNGSMWGGGTVLVDLGR